MKTEPLTKDQIREAYKTLRKIKRKAIKLCDEASAMLEYIPSNLKGSMHTRTSFMSAGGFLAGAAQICSDEMERPQYKKLVKEFRDGNTGNILAAFQKINS